MINRKSLLDAVNTASQAVPSRTPKSVLQSVRLNGNRVEATDGEISIAVTIDAELPDCLIPCDSLKSILREIDCDLIEILPGKGGATIKSERAKFDIACHDSAEWPAFPTIDGETFTVEATELQSALDSLLFCCDITSTRYALGGVVFENGNLAATDSRRLSRVSLDSLQVEQQRVVPHRPLKSLKNIEGAVSVTFSERSVQFSDGRVTVTSKLLEGRFPRWQDVIPKHDTSTTILPETLVRLCRLAALTTTEESQGVLFKFSKDELQITTDTSKGSSVIRESITLKGDPVTLRLNPLYVQHWAASVFPGREIKISMGDEDSAVLLTSGSKDYVLMPLAKE